MKHTARNLVVRRVAAVVVAVALVSTSCGSDTSRGQVLTDVAADTIVPFFIDLEARAETLAAAIDQLCETADVALLSDAHVALAETRYSWATTEAAWLGPVMSRRSWAVIDWPVSPSEIEQLIADPDAELDVERLGKAVGADQRGLGAIEYLLGTPGDTSELSERFATRQCDYLQAVAQVIHNETELLLADWSTGSTDADASTDQIAADGSMALDDVVNDTLFLLEDIGDRELGAALGSLGGEPDAERIIEGPAGLATADIAAHLAGLRAVLIGGDSTNGLRPLLGDDITNRLAAQFDAAEGALADVSSPLRDRVAINPAEVEALRDAVKTIQITIATEVVSRLGVTIGFSDADGDTGA